MRLEIAHAELVAASDIPRFKKLNVIPDMGFQWAKPAFDSIDAVKDYLGPMRFNRVEPEGYLYQTGVPIAQGSDWPVDPLANWFDMKVLVTREGIWEANMPAGSGWCRVFRERCYPCFTINGAYALHSERYFGSSRRASSRT